MPEPAEIGSKDLTQIHAPSQATCWLLTHRFKPTKIPALWVGGIHENRDFVCNSLELSGAIGFCGLSGPIESLRHPAKSDQLHAHGPAEYLLLPNLRRWSVLRAMCRWEHPVGM